MEYRFPLNNIFSVWVFIHVEKCRNGIFTYTDHARNERNTVIVTQ